MKATGGGHVDTLSTEQSISGVWKEGRDGSHDNCLLEWKGRAWVWAIARCMPELKWNAYTEAQKVSKQMNNLGGRQSTKAGQEKFKSSVYGESPSAYV